MPTYTYTVWEQGTRDDPDAGLLIDATSLELAAARFVQECDVELGPLEHSRTFDLWIEFGGMGASKQVELRREVRLFVKQEHGKEVDIPSKEIERWTELTPPRNPLSQKALESLRTLPEHLQALGEWILTDPRMHSSTSYARMLDVARDEWKGPNAIVSTWPAKYLSMTLHCKYNKVASACAAAAQRTDTGYLVPFADAPDDHFIYEMVEAGYLEKRESSGYWMCEEIFEAFDRENKMAAAINRLSDDEQRKLVEFVFGVEEDEE